MGEVEANEASALVKLIANSERIRMLQAMLEGEVRVCALADRAGLAQAATSQHLAKLLIAGIVVQRRDRQSRYNSIVPEWADILRRLIRAAEQHDALRTANSS